MLVGTGAFRVGEAIGQPAVLTGAGSFAVKGFGPPTVLTAAGSFAVKPADPTIFLFDNGWQPVVQRAWGTGWFPGVT